MSLKLRKLGLCFVPVILCVLPPKPASARTNGCNFDRSTLTFAGSAEEQTTCLLRKVGIGGSLKSQVIPADMLSRVDQKFKPTSAQLAQALRDLPLSVRKTLMATSKSPVSVTASGYAALYFVIHDTSTPYLRDDPFPLQIDSDASVNRISGYLGSDAVAHYFVNRAGEIGVGHDFSTAWRATKLESKEVGVSSRGRFLHIELLQPRRRDPAAGGPDNDRLSPDPGFGDRQYKTLVGLYIMASARAGKWMIPAFHASVDDGLSGGHDDPQKFDLAKFDAFLTEALGLISAASSP